MKDKKGFNGFFVTLKTEYKTAVVYTKNTIFLFLNYGKRKQKLKEID